jgi:hypothetical protein
MSRLPFGFVVALLALLCASTFSPAAAQERSYEVYACQTPACLSSRQPLAVTAVRNLQGEQWWRELEVEVKNVSDKPIYYIRFGVSLPETSVGGGKLGVMLRYGRPELIHLENRAGPEDALLRPGETHVFRIPRSVQRTFSGREEWETRKVLLRVDTVSFGDGTGVIMGGVGHSVRR